MAEDISLPIIYLYIVTTYILEAILLGACVYTLIKKRKTVKAIIMAISLPAVITAIFFITYTTGAIKYADLITVVMLFFFNLVAIPVIFPTDTPVPSTQNRNLFIFGTLLLASLFVFAQQLNPQKKKIVFFESMYEILKNKENISYYDARQIDIPAVILQRYGNKQINSEFLTYSLFKHQKSIIIFFPQGEILDAFESDKTTKMPQDMFLYKTIEKMEWLTDTVFLAERNIRDSLCYEKYIPVCAFDSIKVSFERNGSKNGFLHIIGFDDKRVPQFVLWRNYNEEYDSNNWDGKWERMYLNCLIPDKTSEVQVFLKNFVRSDLVDTMYFRNLKVEIKRNDVKL
jgi:hypothetical protein